MARILSEQSKSGFRQVIHFADVRCFGETQLELWTGFLIDTRGNALAISDLDGDGKPDLVLSNRDVLLGNGDGTFQAAQSYSPGVQAGESAVVADFNGDGKPDLAVGELSLARVLLNVSAGFGHATTTTPDVVAESGEPPSERDFHSAGEFHIRG